MIIRDYTSFVYRVCGLSVLLQVAVLVFTVASCRNVLAADTYYVDASASGGVYDGSLVNPWNTLAQVNAAMGTFNPGDHIRFKRGGIFITVPGQDNTLKITVSGEETNPIVFEAYGDSNDPLPILDGSRELGSWTHHGGNIYKHDLAEINRPRILFFNGKAVPPITTLQFADVPAILKKDAILMQKDGVYITLWATSVDHADNTVSGITFYDILPDKNVYARQLDENGVQTELDPHLGTPTIIATTDGLTEPGHWYWDSGKLYLYSEVDRTGSTIPVGYTEDGENDCAKIPGACAENGIDIQPLKEYVVIKDIKVKRFNDFGVVIRKGNNITINGIEIYGCGIVGIQMYNNSNNIIQNTTIDSVSNGISIWAYSPDPSGFSMNNEILNNTVSNCRGGCITLSSEFITPNPDPTRVSENIIYGNTISNANTMSYDGGGVYTWYAGSNTIESNIIRNCGSLVLASAGIQIDYSGGPMTIRNNTIEHNSIGGIAVSGDGHQITGNTLRNNGVSSRSRSAQIGFFHALSSASNCTVTGNIMEAGQGQHMILGNPGSTSGHTINNNLYYSQSKTLFNWNDWSDAWIDFETWKSRTGHDANSKLYLSLPPSILLFMPAILSGSVHNH